MNKTLTLLAATVAAAAFAAPAMAEDKTTYKAETKIEKSASGDYTRTSTEERKDASGKVSAETKVDVDVNKDGGMTKTVETKTVDDPKGLLNKQTTKTEDMVKTTADGKIETSHEKTVNGKKVEDRSTTSPAR